MSSDSALVTTRGVDDAPLPVHYEAARRELAECARVDEAATWANKAAALASYARQSKDDSLEQMAMRIRARAIRRCGELLKELPLGKPGPKSGGAQPSNSRTLAAKEAGLSPDQAKDAVRIAKIPPGEFEDAVESASAPTIESLAERGTKKKPEPLVDIQGRDPQDYNRSLLLNGALHDLAAMVRSSQPDVHLRGCVPRHHDKMRESATALLEWLTKLLKQMEKLK